MSKENQTASAERKQHHQQHFDETDSLSTPTIKKIKWDHPSIILHPLKSVVGVHSLPPGGEFQLPSINDIPHICLIIEIARYLRRKVCNQVFRYIMPKEYQSVYHLVDAERVSKNLVRSFDSKRSRKKIFGPRILVHRGEDLIILFPEGVNTFVKSIVPNYETFKEKEWKDVMVLFERAWTGKESLYSILGYRNATQLLNVSKDDATELWHQWEVSSDWRFAYPDRFKEFCQFAGMKGEPSHVVDLSDRYDQSNSKVWLSHDRKVILTLTEKVYAVDSCSYFMCVLVCTGVRSRSKFLLDWLKAKIHGKYFMFDKMTVKKRLGFAVSGPRHESSIDDDSMNYLLDDDDSMDY